MSFEEINKVKGLVKKIIFGPVESRRFGVSLGINLLPADNKICSFNCPYCECGWTDIKNSKNLTKAISFPSVEDIKSSLIFCLNKFKSESKKNIEHITLAGNGEPTMHPDYGAVILEIRKIVDDFYPTAKFVLLTNGLHIERNDVKETLHLIDSLNIKLDAADEKIYKKINGPIQGTFHDLIETIKRVKDYNIQTMFIEGAVSNTSEEHLSKWLQLVKELNPKEVQIYSIDRAPPTDKVLPVSKQKLKEISQQLQDMGINAKYF